MKSKENQIPKPLINDIIEGKCLAFIGAGFSLNAELPENLWMPDWNKLGEYFSEIVGVHNSIAPIEIAQLFEDKFGRVQLIEYTRKALHYDKAQPSEAHCILANLPFDIVYTTNFDLLLEKAYSKVKRPYRSIVGELQMPFLGGKLQTSIVKFHGDLEHEEHLIISQNDYNEFLNNYPVIATHLSSLLITRTPLFIGYSLNDPDFKNIREVVKSRLGKFERMSYIIQFDVDQNEIKKGLENNVHIISIDTNGYDSKKQAIENFLSSFLETIDRLDDSNSRENNQENTEAINKDLVYSTDRITFNAMASSTANSCFVLMPFNKEMDIMYSTIIAPAVERYGLSAVRADRINRPGSIIEQIRTAIRQSRIVIAEISDNNPNVMYEIGLAQAMGKPIILIANNLDKVPFDLKHLRILVYSLKGTSSILNATNDLSNSIQNILTDSKIQEAENLFGKGQYRASASLAGIALEHTLLGMVDYKPDRGHWKINDILKYLEMEEVLDNNMIKQVRKAYSIRNKSVLQLEEISKEEAKVILSTYNEIKKKHEQNEVTTLHNNVYTK